MPDDSPDSGWFQYLPVTEREIAQGIFVTSVGWQNAPAGKPYPPVGHPATYSFSWKNGRVLPEFAVVFIEKGSGEVEANGLRSELKAGDVFYIPPGEWHRYRPSQAHGWRDRWICCNGEILHRLRNLAHLPGKPTVWPGAGTRDLAAVFNRLSDAVRSAAPANPLLLAGLAMEVVGMLQSRLAETPGGSQESDGTLRRAMEFLWSNSHRPITVRDVAQAAAVSRRTLERRFQQEKGVSVLTALRDFRMERARGLLLDSRLAVKEIAYLCGFLDVRSFIRLFRKECGESPGRWRGQAPPGT